MHIAQYIATYCNSSLLEESPEQYLLDTFTAANGTAISGRAPDVGNTPTIISGTHTISSNAMVSSAAGLVGWNVGHADYEFEISTRVSNASAIMRMDMRLADNTASATHRLILDFTGTEIRLREWNDNATVTNTWTAAFVHALNTDYLIKAVLNGASIKIYVDGVLKLDQTTGVVTGNHIAIFGEAFSTVSARSTHYIDVHSV